MQFRWPQDRSSLKYHKKKIKKKKKKKGKIHPRTWRWNSRKENHETQRIDGNVKWILNLELQTIEKNDPPVLTQLFANATWRLKKIRLMVNVQWQTAEKTTRASVIYRKEYVRQPRTEKPFCINTRRIYDPNASQGTLANTNISSGIQERGRFMRWKSQTELRRNGTIFQNYCPSCAAPRCRWTRGHFGLDRDSFPCERSFVPLVRAATEYSSEESIGFEGHRRLYRLYRPIFRSLFTLTRDTRFSLWRADHLPEVSIISPERGRRILSRRAIDSPLWIFDGCVNIRFKHSSGFNKKRAEIFADARPTRNEYRAQHRELWMYFFIY